VQELQENLVRPFTTAAVSNKFQQSNMHKRALKGGSTWHREKFT